MDGWDLAVLIVTGYLAVVALVRLMISRHNALSAKLKAEIEQEQRRQKKKQPSTRRRAA